MQPGDRIRRARHVFVLLDDATFLDIEQLLSGAIGYAPFPHLVALSTLTGAECSLTFRSFQCLSSIPSEQWTTVDEIVRRCTIDSDVLDDFAHNGLIVTDRADGGPLEALWRKDEAVSRVHWNKYSLLYHSMSRWRDVQSMALGTAILDNTTSDGLLPQNREDRFREFIDYFGEPPPHFHERQSRLLYVDLPICKREGPLYETLTRRKTARMFDRTVPMLLDELAVVLYYVWGCHGHIQFLDNAVGLKKTSPSGGGLHPIEVYPVVTNVAGLDPGMYHYNVERHGLELLASCSSSEAVDYARHFMAGHWFFAEAHVSFIMTARFDRHNWKYRDHRKAHTVVMMDAAHLSQTMYLVATDLGLGAFVTAAINNVNIDEKLGLDGVTEAAIAINGCGKVLTDRLSNPHSNDLEPQYLPYQPRT
jgi:putative peptide maturation dehydrogenase